MRRGTPFPTGECRCCRQLINAAHFFCGRCGGRGGDDEHACALCNGLAAERAEAHRDPRQRDLLDPGRA